MAEKLQPYLKPTVWAGEKLGKGIGEAYLLSSEEKDVPLIKYIDAAGALSVQVHPKGDRGKDEMWIIDDVYKDAEVYIGFRRSVSENELRDSLKSDKIFSLMQRVSVSPGDIFWIPGGTIHAAKGISFFEIQHNRDITYRLYDYGRGRILHWTEGLCTLDRVPWGLKRSRLFSSSLADFLKQTPFSFSPLTLHGVYCQRVQHDLAVVVIKGQGRLNEMTFQKGDCFRARKGEFLSFFGESTLLLCDMVIPLENM